MGVMLARWGFEMNDVRYFKYGTVGRFSGWIFDLLYRLSPSTSDGIVVTARKVRRL